MSAGVSPDTVRTEAGEGTVPLVAVTYRAAVLGERPIVRLVEANLTQAEDLTLGAVGLTADTGSEPPVVGHGPQRALGFPAWVMVTDPDRARSALETAERLSLVLKKASSSGQATYRSVEAMGVELARTTPHFLPTFYEEAARRMLAADQANFAGRLFGKAREAERAHALPIDEDRHAAAFLEFVLSGSISAMEITAESKALLERLEAPEALERFSTLVRERARAGSPPYASVGADVRRLATAAQDKGAEDEVLRDLLESPSVTRAPKGFWSSSSKAIVRLARSDESVRRRLIDLTPDFGYETGLEQDQWIDLLDETGALAMLTTGDADAAAWVQRVIGYAGYSSRLVETIDALGDRLRGVTITLESGARGGADVDVLDALLGAGVEIDGPEIYHLVLRQWVSRRARRDLTHLAAHDALASVVKVGEVIDDLSTLLAHPGSLELLRRYASVDLPEDLSLPAARALMSRFTAITTVESLPHIEDQLEPAIAALRPERVIAGVLRLGLAAEMTWPELERVTQMMRAADPGAEVSMTLSWPAVGVVVGDSVTYVDGDRTVAGYTVGKGSDHSFMLAGGDVLAQYEVRGPGGLTGEAHWASSPGVALEARYRSLPGTTLSFEVEGGRLTGHGLVRPGESSPDAWFLTQGLLSDGRQYWASESTREVDATTGQELDARSVPEALTALAAAHEHDGLEMQLRRCFLAPVTPTTAGSLMPSADGLHALAALFERHRLRAVVTADGTKVDLPVGVADNHTDGIPWPIARPGGGTWIVLDGALFDLETAQELGSTVDWGQGTHPMSLLPSAAWHQLRVRDEAASRRLREVTTEQGDALWLAINAVYEASEHLDLEGTLRELARPGGPAMSTAAQILGSDDETLCRAVVLTANTAGAAALQWFLQMVPIAEAAEGEGGDVAAVPTETFPLPIANLGGLSAIHADNRHYSHRGAIEAVAGSLGLRPRAASEPRRWPGAVWEALGRERAVLALAASPFRTSEELESIAGLVGALHDNDLLGGQVRAAWAPDALRQAPEGGSYVAGSVFGLGQADPVEGEPRALFVSETREWLCMLVRGETQTIGGHPLAWPQVPAPLDPAPLVAGLEHLLEHGQPAWDPSRAEALAEATGWSRATAALLLAGPTDLWHYRANFLAKDVRETLGLKVAEAEAARAELRRIDREVVPLAVLLGAAVPDDDPSRIVTGGPDVEAIARAWHAYAPATDDRPALPAEVVAEAPKAIDSYGTAYEIELLLGGGVPEPSHLEILLWLAQRLPRDSSMRSWVADRLVQLREVVLASTKPVSVAFNSGYVPGADLGIVRRQLGLPRRDTSAPPQTVDVGLLQLQAQPSGDRFVVVPAEVRDWGPVLEQVRSLRDLPLDPSTGYRLELLVGEHLDPLIADLRTTDEEEHHDPRVSVPDLVAQVATDEGLSEDAAAYWLQLLALADPTDRKVQGWTGWTAARRKKAGAELVERGLVVEGKRARAGRSLYLPGGWREASTPHLPLEEWKAAPFALLDRPKVVPALHVVVPWLPFADLFRRAHARWAGGDRPGEEQA